jgi:uncharacterized protein (DUF2267 family)
MSATGLDVFDRTLQTTNIWLNEIMEVIGPERQLAWKVLSVVLHKLRDRLPVDLSAHLGAQLPLLVRGVYYDQYQPARQPVECETFEALQEEVSEWLADSRPVDPRLAILAVFSVLSRHLSEGQISKVSAALPRPIREAFELAPEAFTPGEPRESETGERWEGRP